MALKKCIDGFQQQKTKRLSSNGNRYPLLPQQRKVTTWPWKKSGVIKGLLTIGFPYTFFFGAYFLGGWHLLIIPMILLELTCGSAEGAKA